MKFPSREANFSLHPAAWDVKRGHRKKRKKRRGPHNPRLLPMYWRSLQEENRDYASALPNAWQAASASPSGASLQMTPSLTKLAPSSRQVASHVRIHSPSPQP